MLLLMLERGWPIDAVLNADTGMEFPEMYEHLRRLDEHLYRERGLHITTLKSSKSFEYLMFDELKQKPSCIANRKRLGVPCKGNGWPGIRVRWCTGQLKTHLIGREINRLKQGREDVQYINVAQVCDSSKVTDHHAVVPTQSAANVNLSALPEGEAAVLRLVCRQLLCSVSGPFVYAETTVEAECSGRTFKARGKTIIDLGWREYKGVPEWTPLPELVEGENIAITTAAVREGKTTPPAAFTEDTLLSAMERAGAKETPADVERRGLGTPATRAATIEKLVNGGFAERVKGKLVPTDTGASLVTVLPDALRSPLLTAEWESRLKQIECGKLDAETFLANIEHMVSGLVTDYAPVAEASVLFPTGRTVVGKCPRCGGVVSEAKNGYFCEGLDCKFGLWRDNKFLAAKRISLTRALAAELLEKGRVHLDEIYSQRMDKYYPGDFILHDNGERATYYLSFRGGKK